MMEKQGGVRAVQQMQILKVITRNLRTLVVWIRIAFLCIIYTVMYFKLKYPVG